MSRSASTVFFHENGKGLLALRLVKGKGKGVPRPTEVAQGVPDFHDFCHCEGGKDVTLNYRPSLPPGVFLVLILGAESTPGHMVPSVAMEKITNDTTGDRSRDPPTGSAVP
jgi:hypothetical protein